MLQNYFNVERFINLLINYLDFKQARPLKKDFFHVFTKSAIFLDNTEKIELSQSSLLNCHFYLRTKSDIKYLK